MTRKAQFTAQAVVNEGIKHAHQATHQQGKFHIVYCSANAPNDLNFYADPEDSFTVWVRPDDELAPDNSRELYRTEEMSP